jgi:hypothetical protein
LARKKIRVRGHRFSDAPAMYMKRTKFDRSHVYKTTFNSGKLIPVFVDEVLPGDTTRMSVNYFARLATPVKPIMDNIYLDCCGSSKVSLLPYRPCCWRYSSVAGSFN